MKSNCCSSRCSPGRADAFTLPEVMVAGSLMLLVLGAVLRLMIAGNAYLSLQEGRTELQKDVTLAFLWMSRELRETDADSIQVAPDGAVFASPRDFSGEVKFDSAGRMLWQKYICYYVEEVAGKPCLVRKAVAISPPAVSPPPAPPVDSVRLDNSINYQVKARNVKSVTFNNSVSPMEFTIFGEIVNRRGRKYGMELKTRVYFRN
ncbi:MAG: PilW family protein [Vulcanimicrobiota bacterium]